MLKYTTTEVVFREVPDEVTLAINISNCPIRCPDCHSKELWKDVGKDLTQRVIDRLIRENEGITCIAFMGGDSDPKHIELLASAIKEHYPKLKIAWYSGNKILPPDFNAKYFDYVKLGPYIKDRGPLDNPNTNQMLFKVSSDETGAVFELENITSKFWKQDS